jgi:hypothetical protein
LDNKELHLAPPYNAALSLALSFIGRAYEPVGILVSGTIVRGNPQKNSDLDLVVIHDFPWRQRTQRFFNGVPAEIFVNPAFQISRTFHQEAAAGRPVMAHMIAGGHMLKDHNGIMARLRSDAIHSLGAGPHVSAERMTQLAYFVTTSFEDAIDIACVDADRSRVLVADALVESIKLSFLKAGRWIPRSKTLFSELDSLHPGLGAATRRAIGAATIAEMIALAEPVIREITGASGFFEWETEPQPLDP